MDDQLIGRERERALLQAWVTDALAGRGSLVLLAGEVGAGKTTLARRVLAGSGLEVLEGFGAEGGAAAFGPIVAVLRSSLRSAGGAGLLEGPLAAHLALLLPELGPAAPKATARPCSRPSARSWRRSPPGDPRRCSWTTSSGPTTPPWSCWVGWPVPWATSRC